MPETVKDITVVAFIVYEDKVLLHKHKKMGVWLPLGGHIEPNELPEDAVVREAKEEGGIDINIVDSETNTWQGAPDVRFLKKPEHLLLEDIKEGHQHIDIIYYATCDNPKLNPPEGESKEMEWFKAEELDGLVAPANVSILGKEAISKLNKKS